MCPSGAICPREDCCYGDLALNILTHSVSLVQTTIGVKQQ